MTPTWCGCGQWRGRGSPTSRGSMSARMSSPGVSRCCCPNCCASALPIITIRDGRDAGSAEHPAYTSGRLKPAPTTGQDRISPVFPGPGLLTTSAPDPPLTGAAPPAGLAPVDGVLRVLADDTLLVKMSSSSRRYDSTGSEYMEHAPCISQIATLLADPKRSAMMWALMDGSARQTEELALLAGLSPSSASAHLGRLSAGGLLKVEARGRKRFFRLAAPEIATAIEALASATLA
uniref:HTH arsR-type domain-containing protein n=1 Tax=Solanum lycopersicum TaxID=4081 RepID=A0A494GA04_SOLLC